MILLKGEMTMKHEKLSRPGAELLTLKKQIEITEKKLDFTSDPKLTAALCYEILGLKSRLGYLIDCQKAL